MGLEIPELDDREYAEIIEDARKRISVYSDTWTDHNAHDPGITVLEMLSWVAETHIYQLDQITDAHKRKYLKLMGDRPAPPKPASVRLEVLAGDTAGAGGTVLPRGTRIEADDGSGSRKNFETVERFTYTDATVERVVSEHHKGRTDNTKPNETPGTYFLAFGDEAEQGSAMYIGFRGDPFAGDATDGIRMLDIAVEYHEANLPEPAPHEGDEHGPAFEPSVDLLWQYCIDYPTWYRDDSWRSLRVVRDETNRFYQGGIVALAKPPSGRWTPEKWRTDQARVLGQREGLYWIRCVIRRSGHEVAPQFDSLNVNVVAARHRSEIEHEELRQKVDDGTNRRADDYGETTALPDQVFSFERSPVLEAEIDIGDDPSAEDEWEQRDDLDGSGPDDRHYVLDSSNGEIRFGDGVRGKVPEAGQRVVAERYVHGGGSEGNVSPTTSWKILGSRPASGEHDGSQPVEDVGPETLSAFDVRAKGNATGGRDAESLNAALLRVRQELKTPYRAVSLEDYREVAENTPGLRFGRVRARVKRQEGIEGQDAVPTVSVTVVPHSAGSKPLPSDGFLEAVQSHLERRRLLTDRVEVEAPNYVDVDVAADVRIAPGYSVEGRRAAIEAELRQFLHPLDGYDGEGWPFGRPLYKSELYAVIDAVEGVEYVGTITVELRSQRAIDRDGNVLIDSSSLLCLNGYDIAVRAVRGPAGTGDGGV